MGSVYRARHLKLERAVALKVIAGQRADDPQLRERFRREALSAAAIEHPHVVPVFEADECEGQLYLSMRFVDGVDLVTLIRQEGRLEPTRAVRLVEQIASALDAAHGRGIVHRDVKPANVLVAGAGPEEHAYVTDFGIAKRHGVEIGLTKTGLVVGTLDYLPPEAFRGEPVGPPGDVYALGCVLYQMLVGDVPFPRATEAGKIAAHLHQPAPLVADRVRGVSAALDTVVSRALAKHPRERFASAGMLAQRARAALGRRLPETEVDGPAGASSPIRAAHGLPVQPTPLIGRRCELSAVSESATWRGRPADDAHRAGWHWGRRGWPWPSRQTCSMSSRTACTSSISPRSRTPGSYYRPSRVH